jgi:hypothetical protein
MKKGINMLLLSGLLLTFNLIEGQTWFGPQKIISNTALDAQSVFAIDIDGDGDNDVLSASFQDDKIAWYSNDGFGNFDYHPITFYAEGAVSVNATDIDGDGDADVLSASFMDDKIAWYENVDGNGDFGPQIVITTLADCPNNVWSADIDGDGDQDVLSSSKCDGKVAWYENIDGNGTFGEQNVIVESSKYPTSFKTGDIDGDGDIDVVVGFYSSNAEENEIIWYENTDGNGAFTDMHLITTSVHGVLSIFCSDIDGDGDIDLISGSKYDYLLAWYENIDGNGTFGNQNVIADLDVSHYPNDIFAIDIDTDGDNDVVVGAPDNYQTSGYVYWFENLDGNGNFGTKLTVSGLARGCESVFCIDIDNDADPDVLAALYVDHKITWYENMTTSLGIGLVLQGNISIYPNPSTGKITLSSTEKDIKELRIIDLTGKILLEKTNVNLNETIDLSGLQAGIYFLRARTDKGVLMKKLMKK